MVDRPPSAAFLRLFMAAYFCAGVGYVVSATFIVAIVEQLPGMQGKGSWTFMMVGLAAAPACILWDLIARRVGDVNALTSAFVLQIIGILVPLLTPNLGMTLLGAALFGGTFIGIVSLVLTMAGRFYPTRPAKMMGKMTVAYGIAQIMAPAVTGQLAEGDGSYASGLYLAAFVMLLGTLLMLRLRTRHAKERLSTAVATEETRA
jgi:MFS family permease